MKCNLVVAVLEDKEAYGTEQLCGDLEVGIEGSFHEMRLLWKQHLQY